jgi:hypothetical protein
VRIITNATHRACELMGKIPSFPPLQLCRMDPVLQVQFRMTASMANEAGGPLRASCMNLRIDERFSLNEYLTNFPERSLYTLIVIIIKSADHSPQHVRSYSQRFP